MIKIIIIIISHQKEIYSITLFYQKVPLRSTPVMAHLSIKLPHLQLSLKKITPLRVFMRGKTMQERPNLYLSQAANKLPDAVNLDMFGTHLKVFWSHPQMGFLPLLQRFIFQLCSLPCGLNSAEHLGFKVLSLHYYRGCMC